MGILDELKQQAETLRTAEAQEAERRAAELEYYEQNLRPVMLQVLEYLDELIKQINYVQPERTIAYPLTPDRTTPIELNQSAYKLVIDSSANPRQLDVRVAAQLIDPAEYELSDRAAIDAYVNYLQSYGFKYHRRDQLNHNHRLQSARFTLEGPLQLAMRIQVEPENKAIAVLLKNFARPGVQSYSYRASQINDDVLDRMGRLILHEVDSLNPPVEVPEETREKLRRQLAKAQTVDRDLEENAPQGQKLWERSAQRLRRLSRKKS
ncbi:hypothetical protein [Gilvimarinus xylanilyticus]|uniref:Uncharacterized protein n=1 Tax=Gilvimarinus xylanilyticus TaxID=2944139 RepID=A0A9X2KU43_9GAMM|nr:hypothetical protein [Gilvimarinus xylanilyticus]MCP8899443.1 hypothetical protein [Gilvimarinus xylanilyticus]